MSPVAGKYLPCLAGFMSITVLMGAPILDLSREKIRETIGELTGKMKDAASRLEFEEAAEIRDRISELKKKELDILT